VFYVSCLGLVIGVIMYITIIYYILLYIILYIILYIHYYTIIILYIIIYYIVHTLLYYYYILYSPSSPLPISHPPIPSSLLLIYHPIPTFKVYLSVVPYTYLYSFPSFPINTLTPHVLSEWMVEV